MIIMGEAKDSFIVELSKDELARVLGYNGWHAPGFIGATKRAIIDRSNVDVSRVYSKYTSIAKVLSDQQHDYDKARTKLQEMLDALTPIEPLFNNLNEIYETD
jgi:hypothetical protein